MSNTCYFRWQIYTQQHFRYAFRCMYTFRTCTGSLDSYCLPVLTESFRVSGYSDFWHFDCQTLCFAAGFPGWSCMRPVTWLWTTCSNVVVVFLIMFFLTIYLSIYYFWLHWVFVAVRGLSLVASSWGYSSLRCVGFSLWWLLLLWSTGSRHAGFSSCGSRVSSCGAQA